MTTSPTAGDTQTDTAQDAQPAVAPAGLNLLGDANAGGCCDGGSCALPGA